MDLKTATLIGAAAVAGGAAAAQTPAPAASYAELLEPIPNAVERLRTADADYDNRPARLIEAQFIDHHHHHHHHHHNRRWYLRHGYRWDGRIWTLAPPPHHHHHHHHHHDHY